MATKPKTDFDFEKSLEELNTLVEEMEEGGDSLENALKKFERGVLLTRECQEALKTAEQKVQILLEKNGQSKLSDYEPENE